MENNYYTLNNYFKDTFGEKIYKVSLDGGFSCPNRDGTISKGGCIFCSDSGSGEFAGNKYNTIHEQIEEQLKLIYNKFPTGRVIAYFQNFTNTYGEIEYLKKIYYEALSHSRVAGLAIATRPDCLSNEVLDLLSEINNKYFLWIELGLQTSNDEIARFLNRGYSTSIYENAAKKLNELNIKFVTHIILGLPNSDFQDTKKTLELGIRSGTWGVKFHLLYITKGTKLSELFEIKPFKLLERDEYIGEVSTLISLLPKNIVVHRVTGDGDRKNLIAPLWSLDKRSILNDISKKLKKVLK